VATGGSSSRKKSSEVKLGTPSPVKALRKKIQGFEFKTEDRGVTLSTRDTLNSKEDRSPVRKSKQICFSSTIQLRRPPERRVTIASIEILDDGSVIDLPMEKDF
jgi:hypothetical protein